jgi:hypothetical protein
MYDVPATALTPALIIYLLDVSASMNEPCGNRTRLAVVNDALLRVVKMMIHRSTRGSRISRRYKIAMFAYSSEVTDLLDGIRTIDEVAEFGVPELSTSQWTDTASGFLAVEALLRRTLPEMQHCPAPLVCHMTDGLYNGSDPEPIVARIRAMHVPDGHVLVENIFIADGLLKKPPRNWQTWKGVHRETDLNNPYARKLFHMSSPLPESYRQVINEVGTYHLDPGIRMLFPGGDAQLVDLAFAISASTPLSAQ